MSMRRVWKWASAALSVAACVAVLGGSVSAATARRHPMVTAARPVVLELFTAQGCSACSQANALLQELADRGNVLALTFPVDVWDYLGWSDTLAKPAFTARQKAYVAHFKLRELYTPEMVVDGRRETLGFDREKVKALIDGASRLRTRGPRVRFVDGARRVLVGRGRAPAGGAEVWLVRYDPAERTVKVKAGENKGKTVVQQNVVRDLQRLGPWTGRAHSYRAPAADDAGLDTVVLVQGDKGGPILASAAA